MDGVTTDGMLTGFLYGLLDPRDGALRYVGQTRVTPEARYKQHCSTSDGSRKCDWIAELRALGMKPALRVIRQCSVENLDDEEKKAIAFMRSLGLNLLNSRPGGQGDWRPVDPQPGESEQFDAWMQAEAEAKAKAQREDDEFDDGFPPTEDWTDNDFHQFVADVMNEAEGDKFWTAKMVKKRDELDLAELVGAEEW